MIDFKTQEISELYLVKSVNKHLKNFIAFQITEKSTFRFWIVIGVNP